MFMRTAVLITVALVPVVIVLGVGYWLIVSLGELTGELMGPGTSVVRESFDGSFTAGDFTFGDVEVHEDSADDFELRATVTYAGDEPVAALLEAEVVEDGDIVGVADTMFGVPFLSGDTRRVAFHTTDDYQDGFDAVRFNATPRPQIAIEAVEGEQGRRDVAFSDIAIYDHRGHFAAVTTVTYRGDRVLQARLAAQIRLDGEVVAELRSHETLMPGEFRTVLLLNYDDDEFGDFDGIVLDADDSRRDLSRDR